LLLQTRARIPQDRGTDPDDPATIKNLGTRYKGTLLKGFFYAHLTRARRNLRAPAHLTGVIARAARAVPTPERP
jgi:hypothetical protein